MCKKVLPPLVKECFLHHREPLEELNHGLSGFAYTDPPN